MIQLKRVYDPPSDTDGVRFLVERLWPRGIKKESLAIDAWLKDAAPTTALRQWFGHDPARWSEFRKRYFAELRKNPDAWSLIENTARSCTATLIYSSHDILHNNAVALKEFIEQNLSTIHNAQ
jgi:uncharacterized protein YeaO (DUF488 family)